jgi:hypothetical protein
MSAVPTIAGKLRVDINPIALSAWMSVISLRSNSKLLITYRNASPQKFCLATMLKILAIAALQNDRQL